MLRSRVVDCLMMFAGLATAAGATSTPAPAPSFTISASDVTMPSNGIAVVPLTFTSVNGFVGSVAVLCVAPTVPTGVRAPYCDQGGPVRSYPLTANGTATATMNIVAIEPALVPALRAKGLSTKSHRGETWTLAGLMVLGFGLRRRSGRMARLLGVAVVGLLVTGVSGCGGPPTLTPGAYVFTFQANSVDINPSLAASTTATVTVPAGIVTKSLN